MRTSWRFWVWCLQATVLYGSTIFLGFGFCLLGFSAIGQFALEWPMLTADFLVPAFTALAVLCYGLAALTSPRIVRQDVLTPPYRPTLPPRRKKPARRGTA